MHDGVRDGLVDEEGDGVLVGVHVPVGVGV